MQQKFVERPYPTNHIYPHGNQGNWYGMPPVGHTPPPLPFPHIPPPTYGQTLYQQSQHPIYIGYLPQNTVRVPLHTYQHVTAGASNWQQPIQPVIPQGGIQRQPLQPTSHSMAPVNQARQYGIQQPNVIQDVDTQMNNPQIRQPSIAH